MRIQRLRFATSISARLKGLLREKNKDTTLMLAPCSDIHTFGMKHAIDVAFLDKNGKVLKIYYALDPCKRLRCSGAVCVLERFATTTPWIEEGKYIGFTCYAKE